MRTQLDTSLECYEAAIKSLKQAGSSIQVEQVLEVLKARDAVQVALKEQKSIPTSGLKQVIELDAALREKAELITKTVNCKTIEQFAQWRESLYPPAEAWWWRLESLAPPHPWDVCDWLWKGLTVATWTANLSLLVNIATRFLSGGVGLPGAAAVILPSIFALLQASSELTKAGQEGFDKLLEKLNIPKQYREEAKLGSALLLSVILISIWCGLSLISNLYNGNGLKNYNERNLGEAEQDYLKEIALNAENIEAHYNLGNLYEEWQELEKAKKEYQIAVAGNLPDAYNNLGRLHIQDKKYPQAAALLAKGLLLAQEKNSEPKIRYSLFKNLGWVRLEQGRYEEARQTLQAAIGITNNPEAANYISNPGAAHCLLAQALDKQKQPKALEQWQKCCQLGSRLNPDEDTWLHLSQEKLSKAGKKCTTPKKRSG
jgi:tetratricopeptide (TPR) repeat protein